MSRPFPSRVARRVLALLICLPGLASADTVASLLGNFTINQYEALKLDAGAAHVHYTVVFGQLPALRELHLADADGDGVTTQQERDAYVAKLAPDFASSLVLSVDGVVVPLKPVKWISSLPTEQGGFSMRLDVDYDGVLPPLAAGATARVAFDNRNYAGRIGWREISIAAAPGLTVFDTDGYANSLTNGLNDALQQLPSAGPLDERTVRLRYADGPAPVGSVPIGLRPADGSVVIAQPAATGASTPVSDASAPFDEAAWLQRRTKQLVDLISTPTVAPHVAVLALLVAMVLGALHAFSPGHGKTIVGAYLIGSRSTPRHAIFLGITVTITHTLVVFAVGLATLFASRYILPEQLFPALSLLSGLLVLGMGVVLFMQRWRGARNAVAELLVRRLEKAFSHRAPAAPAAPGSADGATMRPLPKSSHQRFGMTGRASTTSAVHDHGGGHAHSHAHDHAHPHPHAHDHAHVGAGAMHSHGGGTMHSHLPPGGDGEPVSWRSLLALGVSGGLVPCPSAMVLLLAAIALNKTFYGLLMVIAFSLGLALTLIAVGFLFLYARSRFAKPLAASLWPQVLPAVSAVLITVVGLFLCYGALTSVGVRAVGT